MNYIFSVIILILFLWVGCLLYAKYSQCDPLRANLISRPDQVKVEESSVKIKFVLQMYPLFITETLGRIPGLTGLFISCILSATLSTFSSGMNSMATVILEDIYKRLSSDHSMSNESQLLFSKILCNFCV